VSDIIAPLLAAFDDVLESKFDGAARARIGAASIDPKIFISQGAYWKNGNHYRGRQAD
jgi:hypothetical protein